MFDLENLNPTTKFYWTEDEDIAEENKEWVELRLINDEKSKEIHKSIGAKIKKELVKDKETRQMQYVRDFELTEKQIAQYDEEAWDYQIYNWKLITPNQQEIECNRENKILLMRKEPRFKAWIERCIEELSKEITNIKSVESENFLNG